MSIDLIEHLFLKGKVE